MDKCNKIREKFIKLVETEDRTDADAQVQDMLKAASKQESCIGSTLTALAHSEEIGALSFLINM